MARRELYTGQPGTSSAAAYTASSTHATLTAATVHNPTGGAVTLNAWLVPLAGSATDANKIISALSVAANETKGLQSLVAHTLNPGSAVHLSASAGASLTVRLSGDIHG